MGNNPSELSQDSHRQKEVSRITAEAEQKFNRSTNWNRSYFDHIVDEHSQPWNNYLKRVPGNLNPIFALSYHILLGYQLGPVNTNHIIGNSVKVVIRGERNTGKSCLLNRLQGKPFLQEYMPSETLNSANINWNYRTSSNIVKIEVWDVIDGPKVKKNLDAGLKLATTQKATFEEDTEQGIYDEVDLDTIPVAGRTGSTGGNNTLGQLDASKVDVLRGTHAVLLLFNPFKPTTWDYVKREIPKIPKRIQVLVMSNFRDLPSTPDKISTDEVRTYLELQDRPIYLLESSMQNCYGLRGLKTFLNLPFLLLQREVLETQLKLNADELTLADEEYQLTTKHDSYDLYLQAMSTRAKQAASPSTPTPASIPQSPKAAPRSNDSSVNSNVNQSKPTTAKASTSPNVTPPPTKPSSPPPKQDLPKQAEEGGFFWKLFGKKDEALTTKKNDEKKAIQELEQLRRMGAKQAGQGSVDDFIPDSDSSWLDSDDNPVTTSKPAVVTISANVTSSSSNQKQMDDDDSKPSVIISNYEDELDTSDELMMAALAKVREQKAAQDAKKAAAVPTQSYSSAFTSAIHVTKTPAKVTQTQISTDDDDEDDANPMLAAYEDDLDFDDQQIKGKPAPVYVKPVAAVKLVDDSSDSDDDLPNPHLANYQDDFEAPVSKSAPTTPSLPTVNPTLSNPSIPSSPPVAKVVAPASTMPVANQIPKQTVKVPVINVSDSDEENNLVAKDYDDNDEDYAGYVPKKTAPIVQTALATKALPQASSGTGGSIFDFNPLDASSEADSDAFWANTRTPTKRVASKPVQTQAPTQISNGGPFSFSTQPILSPSNDAEKSKDKRDKKEKRHKHKEKDRESRSQPPNVQSPPTQSPPPVTTPPPPVAQKKSMYYL